MRNGNNVQRRRDTTFLVVTGAEGETQHWLSSNSQSAVKELKADFMPIDAYFVDNPAFNANAAMIASIYRKGELAGVQFKPDRSHFKSDEHFIAVQKQLRLIWHKLCVSENVDHSAIEKALYMLQKQKVKLTPSLWQVIICSKSPWFFACALILGHQLGLPLHDNIFSDEEKAHLDRLDAAWKERRLTLTEIKERSVLLDKKTTADVSASLIARLRLLDEQALRDIIGILSILKSIGLPSTERRCVKLLLEHIYDAPVLLNILTLLSDAKQLDHYTFEGLFYPNRPNINEFNNALVQWLGEGLIITSTLLELLQKMDSPEVVVRAFITSSVQQKSDESVEPTMYINTVKIHVKKLQQEESLQILLREQKIKQEAEKHAAALRAEEAKRNSFVVGASGSFRRSRPSSAASSAQSSGYLIPAPPPKKVISVLFSPSATPSESSFRSSGNSSHRSPVTISWDDSSLVHVKF